MDVEWRRAKDEDWKPPGCARVVRMLRHSIVMQNQLQRSAEVARNYRTTPTQPNDQWPSRMHCGLTHFEGFRSRWIT